MIAEKLRKSILQAAIEGKLTEQLPEDGDARDLVEKIKKEKEELIKAGKIKKEKPLPEITEDEIPFDIPDNWCWVRLGEIYWNMGQTKPSKKLSYIDTGAVDNNKLEINYDNLKQINKNDAPSRARKIIINNSVIFSSVRPYLRNVAVINFENPENYIASTAFIVMDTLIHPHFLKYYLVSDWFISETIRVSTGSNYPAINDTNFKKLIIALPPLDEQERIVKQLDKIIKVTLILEESEKKLIKLDSEFSEKLKNSILQAAMQGELTDQLPEDGDAHVLLEEFRVQKERLIAEGKIKKQKLLPEITADEIPFDIPDNWVWVRLGDCTDMYTGNSIPKLEKELEYEGLDEGYPYIATKDVWFDGTVDYKNGVRIPFDEPKFRIADAGTPLLCIEGGSAGRKIGMLNQDVCFGNKLCNFNPIGYNEKFLFYYLQSSSFLSNFKEGMTGIIGGISLKNLKNIIIPIPPIYEQKRIVSNLEKLLF